MVTSGGDQLSASGVLFLDELPEFGSTKLEGLRWPPEDHTLTMARAAGTLRFPS
jgi:magnesium chelatase family protein